MKNVLKNLLFLQELELSRSEDERRLELLRKRVPEALLEVFDRWIDRGKKPVAIVRHGVCCECHLKIASGVLVNLAHADQIQRCGNCGRILHFAADEHCNERNSSVAIKRNPRTRRSARQLATTQQSIQMIE